MLFLAVFSGFLAENMREHMVEKRREKEYMESLVKDLQSDTAACNIYLRLSVQQSQLQDSLIRLVNAEKYEQEDILKLYQLSYATTRIVHAPFENRTAVQLKNSGSMRLIGNTDVADSIRAYWAMQETADRISDRIENAGSEVRNIAIRIFNNKYASLPDLSIAAEPVIAPDARFIQNDPVLFAEYSNRVFTKRRIIYNYIVYLNRIHDAATGLMKLIRDEYHLKER